MTTKAKIAVGILGAAAAGVVIGLLIAPEKGSDIRKKLKKQAGHWADNLSNLFVKGQEEFEEAKEKVKGAKSAAEDKVTKIKEALS